MIRKLVLLAVLAGVFASQAFAEDKSSGCGLGWAVTKKQSFLGTTTRNTTNVFIPNTFGMTSGTMGCAQHSIAKKEQPAVNFVLSNYDTLQMDMAQGGGEYVTGLATLMGCGDGVQAEFGRMTQSKYREIFGNGKATPVQVFQNVKTQVQSTPALASGCSA